MRVAAFAMLTFALSSGLALSALAQSEPTDPVIAIQPNQIPGDFSAAMADAAEGRAMFLAGDHEAALDLLLPLADAGNPVAQNILGIALTDLNSAYVPYDAAEGFRYLLAAGAQNFGPAMHNLGDAFEETHDGFAPDLEASSSWFIAAAELGYEPAYYNAGFGLVNGNGVVADDVAGRAWLTLALDGEERGYALGLFGDLAYFGQSQPQDFAVALDYYLQAAQAGNAEGAWYAAYQYLNGEGTPIDAAAALPLLEQAVAEGEVRATGSLALLLAGIVGDVETDPDRALTIAVTGDAQGSGFASAVLGDLYRLGIGTEVDLDLARAAYERGAAHGEADAAYQLGDMAYFGRGEPVDYARAFELFHDTLAVFPAHAATLYSIAYMQMRGEGTEVDLPNAVLGLEQVLEQNNRLAIIEAIELFGSPTYAGAHSNEVRAQAYCIYVGTQGWLTEPGGDFEDHIATCARLAETLNDEDSARAADIAATL